MRINEKSFKMIILNLSLYFFMVAVHAAERYTWSDASMVMQQEVAQYQIRRLTPATPINTFTIPVPSVFTKPSILLGIYQIDIDTRTTSISYSVEAKLDTFNNITITAKQFNDSIITNMRIFYFLVENPSIYVTSEVYSIPSTNKNLLISIAKFYKKPNQIKIPTINAFITGYKCLQKGTIHKLSISVVQSSVDFFIQIERSDDGIYEVSYNFIEVYNEGSLDILPISTPTTNVPYYVFEDGQENTYKNSQSTSLYEDVSYITDGKERFTSQVLVPVDITISNTSTFNNTQIGIFFGFTGFDFDLSNKDQGLRLQIDKVQFSSRQISFQYRTWNTARVRGVQTEYFYIKMIDCSQYPANPINHQQKCISTCPSIAYYQNTDNDRHINICSKCNTSCLTCSGPANNNCLSCISEAKYFNSATKACDSCPSSCLECTDFNTCTKCSPNFPYFFNNKCLASQPPNAYCDQSTKVCISCPPTCKTCSFNMKCITCKNDTDYFKEGECTILQPPFSYCNSIRICQSCPAECQSCDANLFCTQCKDQNNYWFQGKCLQTQPPYTYCNVQGNIQQFCKECHKACKECAGPAQNQCSSCQDGFSLENGQTCNCSQPAYSFDPYTQECAPCLVIGCSDCKKDIKICNACQISLAQQDPSQELTLDSVKNQCYCKNKSTYYSSQFQRCIANTIQNCQASTRFENKCDTCKNGYYNVEQKMCSYCGKYKYSNERNECVQPCMKNCLICIDSNTCIVKENEIDSGNKLPDDYSNYKCHYSCAICNGNSPNNCLKCASQTRHYSIETSTCSCQSNSYDAGFGECLPYKDISEFSLQVHLFIFITFFITILPFLFHEKYSFLNHCFSIIHLLSILSFDSNLNQKLNYVKLLSYFQKLSIVNAVQFQFISIEQQEIQEGINYLIIPVVIQFISCFLRIFLFLFKKNNKIIFVSDQLLLTCNRLTSTTVFCIASNLFFNSYSLLSSDQIIMLILSISSQSLLSILTFALLSSYYLNNRNPKAENSLQNLYNTNQTQLTSSQSLSNQPSIDIKPDFYITQIVFEVRRLVIGIIVGAMNQNETSILIVAALAFSQIVLFLISKPHESNQKNCVAIFIESFLILCFFMHSQVKPQISKSTHEENENTTEYFILVILFSIYLILILVVSQSLIQIFQIIHSKIKSKTKTVDQQIEFNQKFPDFINKNQIDSILDPSSFWSNNPYPRNLSKKLIFQRKKLSQFY